MKKRKSSIPAQRREFSVRMAEILGSEAAATAFFESLKEMAVLGPRSLRLNSLKSSDKELIKNSGLQLTSAVPWCAQGFFMESPARKDLVANPCVGAGLVYLQEAGAMEAVEMLNPVPGEWVLDLCAAPGGKSTQIGEKLSGQGWMVVNDPVRKRAQRLDSIVARHGITNVSVYSLEPRQLSELYSEAFDKILVDAPCSGESLFAKRNELRVDVRDVDVLGCARRQFAILKEASKMIKEKGVLVYSTCTYSREENEDLLQTFIREEESEGKFWILEREQRRWPHVDEVAGGYCARLILKERKISEGTQFPSHADNRGLIRHSWIQWNGEIDLYAALMCYDATAARESVQKVTELNIYEKYQELGWPEWPAFTSQEVDDRVARSYLSGESIHGVDLVVSGLRCLKWKSWAIGPAKAVDKRLNNLLPKILRELA